MCTGSSQKGGSKVWEACRTVTLTIKTMKQYYNYVEVAISPICVYNTIIITY